MAISWLIRGRGNWRRAAALCAIGVVIVAAICIGWRTSPLSTSHAVALVLGCDVVVAGLGYSRQRGERPATNTPTFVLRCLAETIFWAAFTYAGIIAVFGQTLEVAHLGYFLTALFVVPTGVVLSGDAKSGLDKGDSRASAALLALTGAAVVATRLLGHGHVSLKLLVCLVAARVVASAASRRAVVTRLPAWDERWSAVVPIALALIALVFVPNGALTVIDLLYPALTAVAVGLAMHWGGVERSRWWRIADVLLVIAAVFLIFELSDPDVITVLNGNYFLGPALDIEHGQPMLVDTYSQYGVGMLDFLALVFSVFKIGYGTFQLSVSVLTVLQWLVIYAVLRTCTRSRLIAAVGMAVAAVFYIFGSVGLFTDYPSTGVLRFGLPWVAIGLAVASAQATSRRRTMLNWATLLVVAIAAQWSGEAGIYCLGTVVAIALVDAAVSRASAGARLRRAGASVARLLGAYVAGIVLFSAITRIATGHWPSWGPYLQFVRLYTAGGLGAEGIAEWSPGLGIAAAYAVSATVLIGLIAAAPDVIRQRLAAFRAITGLTAFGALDYTYFLGRSDPNNLVFVSPPLVVAIFIWLGLLVDLSSDRRMAMIATIAVSFVGGLVIAGERSHVTSMFKDTALSALIHPAQLKARLGMLRDNPLVSPQSLDVETFVRQLHMGSQPLILQVNPVYETEALVRLDRANVVGSSNPCQEAISPSGASRLLNRVRHLKPGGVLVTVVGATYGPLAPIQTYEETLLKARFTLTPIGPITGGLAAYHLGPVRATWRGGGIYPAPPAATTAAQGCG